MQRDWYNVNLEPALVLLLVALRRNAANIWVPANRYRRRGENFWLDVPSKARNATAFLPDRRPGNFPTRFDDATSREEVTSHVRILSTSRRTRTVEDKKKLSR